MDFYFVELTLKYNSAIHCSYTFHPFLFCLFPHPDDPASDKRSLFFYPFPVLTCFRLHFHEPTQLFVLHISFALFSNSPGCPLCTTDNPLPWKELSALFPSGSPMHLPLQCILPVPVASEVYALRYFIAFSCNDLLGKYNPQFYNL